jgi:hypothetical protein
MSAQSEAPRFPFPSSPVPYDPGPEMRQLMGKCPVNKVQLPDDSTAWLVTGYDEAPVEAILVTDAGTAKPVPLDD